MKIKEITNALLERGLGIKLSRLWRKDKKLRRLAVSYLRFWRKNANNR
jgi:hypothetical protein